MNYTDSVPLASEKKREKILTFGPPPSSKTKTFLVGKELKTDSAPLTLTERQRADFDGGKRNDKTQPKTPG